MKELEKSKKSGKKTSGSAYLDDVDADEGNSKYMKKRKGGRQEHGKMKVKRLR